MFGSDILLFIFWKKNVSKKNVKLNVEQNISISLLTPHMTP